MSTKCHQLQIRVSAHQKNALQKLSKRAGLTVSAYVLSRTLPAARLRFDEILLALRKSDDRRFLFAELNELLASLAPMELRDAVSDANLADLSPYDRNYVAAMVEQAARIVGIEPPAWTLRVEPLEKPHFATQLPGLRLHLLHRSPVPFKRRNIFVDSSIGHRV